MVRRSLEHHVLQQVGHARLAVTLVPRADEDGQVDGDLGPRWVGKEQHLQPVGQAILRDSLDRGDLAGRGRVGSGQGGRDNQPQRQGGQAQRYVQS